MRLSHSRPWFILNHLPGSCAPCIFRRFGHLLVRIWTRLPSFVICMLFLATSPLILLWRLLWWFPISRSPAPRVQAVGVVCSEPAAIDLVVTFGVRRVRVGGLGFGAALAHGAIFVVDTAHWVWSESAVRWRGVGIPLELFFPIPSLSTTSSLHLMRRTEEGSLALGVSSPLSRRVPVSRTVDESRDSVVVWSWGVVPGWRVRDMTTDNNSH